MVEARLGISQRGLSAKLRRPERVENPAHQIRLPDELVTREAGGSRHQPAVEQVALGTLGQRTEPVAR